MRHLFSFDIDGTLEIGAPPGPIPIELVRSIQEMGHFIGSCSDRTLADQTDVWKGLGLPVDFVALKTHLPSIRGRFEAASYYHIGDTVVDRMYADRAGFTYLLPDLSAVEALLSDRAGEVK